MKKLICLCLVTMLMLTATACSVLREFHETILGTVETDETSQTPEATIEVSTTDMTETSLTTEETTEPTTEAITEESAPPAIPVDSQLALIAENKALWLNEDEFLSAMIVYSITDLDQNGRVEIVCGCNMGTGLFTYAEVWQVSEDGETLEKTDFFEEGYSRADFFLSETVAYHDREADVYFYMFNDDARSGWMWNGTEKRAVWLKDGTLNEETLAYRSCDTDEEYNTVITYYDSLGNPITEEEFEIIAETVFASLEKLDVSILWQSVSWDELETLEGRTLLEKLLESAQGFSLSKADPV